MQVFLFILCCIVAFPIYSADLAEFQIIIPAPDPVSAGEGITFQIIGANKGAKTWLKGKYEFEAEIYDSKRTYILKTGAIKGEAEVPVGETFLQNIPFNVPSNYAGIYYFRISINYDGQRIAYSDFQPFNVTPLAVIPRVVPKVKVGGNAILSYRNDSKTDWQNYAGNLSLNLLGSIHERAVTLNLYTYHTNQKPVDLYNILLSYYSEALDFSAGDIMPNFSILTMSNSGVRGVYPVIKTSAFTTSVIGARSAEGIEGSSVTTGSYARYIYGIDEKISIPGDNSIGFSYVVGEDDKSSISTTGPVDIRPVRNEVMGANLRFGTLKKVVMLADFAQSGHSTDTIRGSKKLQDTAYRVGAESRLESFNARVVYQTVGTDFNSLGSPTTVKDRQTQEFSGGMHIRRVGNISAGYTNYSDNLKADPKKVTTTQKISSAGMGFAIPKLPSVNFGYSVNDVSGVNSATGTVVNVLKNNTDVLSFGVSYSIRWLRFTSGGQSVKFIDALSPANNRDTLSVTVGTNLLFNDRVSLNMGFTNTKTENPSDLSVNKTDNVSVTTNFKIVPAKLVLAVWGNFTTRKDDSRTSPAETAVTTGNTEITYYFSQQFAWTVGGGQTVTSDKLDTAKGYDELRLSTRLSIGF